MLTIAVFQLVQQCYHATEIGNVAIYGQRLRWSAIVDKKDNYFGQSKNKPYPFG